ncbi:unnamed protein product, partial [Polarella glacialis]
ATPSSELDYEESTHLAVCTADQLLVRELEISSRTGVTVRNSTRQQASRGVSWSGLCSHPVKAAFFAASSDRRVLQLDAAGKIEQEVRLTGSLLLELTG